MSELGPWTQTLIRIEFLKNTFYGRLSHSKVDIGGEHDAHKVMLRDNGARPAGQAGASEQWPIVFRISDAFCHCLCLSHACTLSVPRSAEGQLTQTDSLRYHAYPSSPGQSREQIQHSTAARPMSSSLLVLFFKTIKQ